MTSDSPRRTIPLGLSDYSLIGIPFRLFVKVVVRHTMEDVHRAVGLVISGFVNMPLIVGEGLCQRPERKKKEQKQAII